MEEKKTLTEVLAELSESIKDKKEKEELEKNKPFNAWIPWNAKVGKRKIKKNYVLVDRWYTNRSRSYERAEIKDNTIMIDGVPRLVTAGDIMLYKGKTPMVTIADWSTVPISPIDHFDKSQIAGYGTKGWKILYNRMKNSMIEEKKKVSMGLILGIIVVIVIAGYFAFKGGLF